MKLNKLHQFAQLALLSSCLVWATEAAAAKTFFCKATISSIGDPSPTSLSGSLVYDMGTVGSCTDGQWAAQFNTKCEGPANNACSSKALGDANFNSAAFWCPKGVPSGSTIRAYAAVSTGKYNAAQTKGILINTPAVTQQKCPAGWASNTTNVVGGVTTDGKCKKTACLPNTVSPPPPNGTPIGTWGFSWGSEFLAYSSPANGGAPITTIITPAVCKWQ